MNQTNFDETKPTFLKHWTLYTVEYVLFDFLIVRMMKKQNVWNFNKSDYTWVPCKNCLYTYFVTSLFFFHHHDQQQCNMNVAHHDRFWKSRKKMFLFQFCIIKCGKISGFQKLFIFYDFQLDCQLLKILTNSGGKVAN